ncbi:putative C6 transcription factor [Dactylonectria estremocensis]|uniref:C6 transcription factor n=1 Tax=Dactylonectria estremocensis TaxID=1079267 RepID=A0A9P9EFF6_9HYPO|nr:putative C6 transcription factor [Dactylonectria estremocensis]
MFFDEDRIVQMVSTNGQTRSKPVAIAPAPAGGFPGDSTEPMMPYTCQPCAKRKVKCNKAAPTCSSCHKSKLECVYQAPQPRWRKRKLSGDVLERLARYEGILREHNLLDADASPSVGETRLQDPVSLHWNEPEPSGRGTLLAGDGKSRYINSNLWHNLGDDEIQPASDDEDYEDPAEMSDPLTGAFMGSQQSILQYHPTHAKAMLLWATHVDVVEPICKVLHIPSTAKMVEMVSQKPEMASRTDECLLFAVYHFAVFAMTDEECVEKLGHTRATLRKQYHFAARQALVNASFLKTTEMSVLQALVLFLMSCRYVYDSQTYWILTGVAVRIAQRMGLHRDGEDLGLPPFEIQMRRRLFYQLIPLEGVASQMSGAGIAIPADAWDTKPPLNVDDDQIWPGMTEPPKERQGATEMIFCLTRTCIGKFVVRAGKPTGLKFKDVHEADLAIGEAEREVEEKYIRYCDILNPLHFLAMGLARGGITAMRMRIRLPKVRNKTASDAEQREVLQLARKIIDTDAAVCSHAGLEKYRWHVRPFSIWGMWDSLIFLLTSLLTKLDLFSPGEVDAEWKRVQQVYQNHSEVLESKRALFVAFGRLTLKAWGTRSARDAVSEPAFISILYSLQAARSQTRDDSVRESGDAMSFEPSSTSGEDVTGIGLDFGDGMGDDTNQGKVGNNATLEFNFSPDAEDWIFWDQLIHEHQTQVVD